MKNSNNVITTIDILRHGECKDGHCYRGSMDIGLTEEGYETMWQSLGLPVQNQASLLPVNKPWKRVISSPLKRCSKFAKRLCTRHQLPLHEEVALQEMHFGEWEGQSINYIWGTRQAEVERWYDDPVAFPPPGGEAADVFSTRVSHCLLDLVKRYRGEHFLMITHAGVIRSLLAQCLSMSLNDMKRIKVPYGCLSRIEIISLDRVDTYHFRLIGHNMSC